MCRSALRPHPHLRPDAGPGYKSRSSSLHWLLRGIPTAKRAPLTCLAVALIDLAPKAQVSETVSPKLQCFSLSVLAPTGRQKRRRRTTRTRPMTARVGTTAAFGPALDISSVCALRMASRAIGNADVDCSLLRAKTRQNIAAVSVTDSFVRTGQRCVSTTAKLPHRGCLGLHLLRCMFACVQIPFTS